MKVNLKLVFQEHVPVFLIDHVLVKLSPAVMVVPFGMLTSNKNAELLQPTAPNVAVGLGPGVPDVVGVGEIITTGGAIYTGAFVAVTVPVGVMVAVGVPVGVTVALGFAAAVWLNWASNVCAADV
jgi:hypothetical protein